MPHKASIPRRRLVLKKFCQGAPRTLSLSHWAFRLIVLWRWVRPFFWPMLLGKTKRTARKLENSSPDKSIRSCCMMSVPGRCSAGIKVPNSHLRNEQSKGSLAQETLASLRQLRCRQKIPLWHGAGKPWMEMRCSACR